MKTRLLACLAIVKGPETGGLGGAGGFGVGGAGGLGVGGAGGFGVGGAGGFGVGLGSGGKSLLPPQPESNALEPTANTPEFFKNWRRVYF